MLPVPRRLPLFPYTTLFRSLVAIEYHRMHAVAHQDVGACESRGPRAHDRDPPARRVAIVGAGPDRKSTRLNSSHANISYAVFCLKKKKQHNNHSFKIQTSTY